MGNQPDEQAWRKKRTRGREKLTSLSTGHGWHHLVSSPQPFWALHLIIPTLQMRKLSLETINVNGPRE